MGEWLRLLRCAVRLTVALVTGNVEALNNVEADVNALHGRRASDG